MGGKVLQFFYYYSRNSNTPRGIINALKLHKPKLLSLLFLSSTKYSPSSQAASVPSSFPFSCAYPLPSSSPPSNRRRRDDEEGAGTTTGHSHDTLPCASSRRTTRQPPSRPRSRDEKAASIAAHCVSMRGTGQRVRTRPV